MRSDGQLRIHAFVASSFCNGPGRRCVVWVQGCSLGCAGCFNPSTHTVAGGQVVTAETLFQWVLRAQIDNPEIEGITVSGGEPLQQRKSITDLLRSVREHTNLSVILFTGYDASELALLPDIDQLRSQVDVIIAGRYEQEKRLGRSLIGSANKEMLFFSDRYCETDFWNLPESEVMISADGQVIVSGIDPVQLEIR